jgi:SAM-dependent methyltransferase
MTACDICGGQIRLRYKRVADYVTGEVFDVWRCAACGSGRTLPVPEDMAMYYPVRYRQYKPFIAFILRVLYARRVARWVRLFEAPGAAFEMGCGNGLMLHLLRRRGWQVTGSERAGDAARAARETFGLTVVEGGPDQLDPASRFDLILLIQVLEHLDDAAGTIKELALRLAPGGKLIIGVPNFASWQAAFGGTGWFHLDVPRHLRHFSLAALVRLLEGQGLDVTRVSYMSPEHDPYGWVQSLLNRIDGKPNRLTRLLMGLDRPGPMNLLHLALGCAILLAAVPLSALSCAARRGAMLEVTCHRQTAMKPNLPVGGEP